jgi:hypothetical protein
MTVGDWLISSKLDAEKRGLPELGPVLEALGAAIAALRAAESDPALRPVTSTQSLDRQDRA